MNKDGQFDVVVAGGGIAGISAALAAARNGAKTCIIEKGVMLGGLATAGLIVIYLPLCDGMGNQIIYGIGEELLKLSLKYDTVNKIPACWEAGGDAQARKGERYKVVYNPYLFMIAAEELLQQEGVEIIFDSVITSVEMDGRKISSVLIHNKSGDVKITGKTFVDATGDADLCALSGENTAVYKENRLASWNYIYDGEKYILNALAKVYNAPVKEGERVYDGTDYRDITQSILDSRQMLKQDLFKRRETKPHTEPATIPCMPLMRMTRRLAGAYELDEAEERVWFEDTIGMTGDWRNHGPVFYLPYRSLYGNKVGNLIAAGRCISVTTDMWDITRVIPTCAVTGQAAGAAAALAAKDGCRYSELNGNALQKTLLSQGVYIDKKFVK